MGSSRTRDWTLVFCMGKQILYHWATRKAPEKFIYVTHIQTKEMHIWDPYPLGISDSPRKGLWSIRKIYHGWRARRKAWGPFWEQLRWAYFFTPGKEERPNTPKRRKRFSKSAYIISDVFKLLCKKFDKFTLISAPGNLPVWQAHD